MSTKLVMRLFVVLALLAGLLGFAAPAFAAASDIVVSYTVPATQINVGDNFSVPVSISVDSAEKLTGLQFNMSWNPALVDLVSVTKGTFFTNCSAATTDFYNAPTLDHVAGTMTNYGIAGLGIAAGQGCYNTGSGANSTGTLLVTLNFHAVANGKSTQAISGILFSDPNSASYSAANYTFPGFFMYVGAAPHLTIQSVAFTVGTGNNFTTVVTVANTGGSASDPDTMSVIAGSATPSSTNVNIPSLAAGTNQAFNVPMVLVGANSLVTASIPSFSATNSNTYALAAAHDSTNIDASFGANISITTPSSVSLNNLSLGSNTSTTSINVKCDSNYAVDVTSDQAFYGTQFNGISYIASSPLKLASPLHVISGASGGSHDVTNGTGATLISGGTPTSNAGSNYSLTLSQTLQVADQVLTAGQTYHQVLTFNSYVTL